MNVTLLNFSCISMSLNARDVAIGAKTLDPKIANTEGMDKGQAHATVNAYYAKWHTY